MSTTPPPPPATSLVTDLLNGSSLEPDLQFLEQCSSEELDDLVHILVYDTDGEKRITGSLDADPKYIRHSPDHKIYLNEIVEEFKLFGGNSFANLFRGNHGVPYKEILCDVCDKLDVKYNKNAITQKIEEDLLITLIGKAIKQMPTEKLDEFSRELGWKKSEKPTPETVTAACIAIFRAGGFKSYQYTVIIANAIMKALFGKGLSLAGNALLTKIASILTGPVGWTITATWTSIDIAGPAYRVTIPAVIQIIYLRALTQNRGIPPAQTGEAVLLIPAKK